MRDGLQEFLSGSPGEGIKFFDLVRVRTRHVQRFSFRGKLRYQSNGLRSRSVYAAAGEQQIAHEAVAQVAFQPWYSAKTRYQPQPQFGKCKSRHLVGDNNVADQGEFQSAAKTNSMHRRNGYKRRRVDSIQYRVNALQKLSHACESF